MDTPVRAKGASTHPSEHSIPVRSGGFAKGRGLPLRSTIRLGSEAEAQRRRLRWGPNLDEARAQALRSINRGLGPANPKLET